MTKARRVGTVLTGLFMLALGLLMAIDPWNSYKMIVFCLAITLLFSAVRGLVYFFTMARHMVGGRTVLYSSIIVLDLGLFTLSLTDVPLIFVVLYLAAMHGFSGFVDIMRAREARRLQAGSWRLNFSHGLVNVIMAVLCLIFLSTEVVAAEIYAIGLIYTAVIRIIQAFRRTAVVYIQ